MWIYEKKLQYNNAYNREVYRSFSVRLDKVKEKKVIFISIIHSLIIFSIH